MQWKVFVVCLIGVLASASQLPAQATGRITGTVTDAQSSKPLAGASVTVVGTQRGAVSGADGQFVIPDVPAGTHAVRASLVGYAEGSASVSVQAGGSATVTLRLSSQALSLEGVVAIGYGTVRRKEVTGSVATVDEEELRKVPTSNVTEALQGKLPGVDITRSSGSPNSGVSLRVRGNRSLTASNSPLYIIDGVQFGSINDLNPNDIASIQVLKDAASTAIYGSRGANGVVLVTTKSGAGARTSVTVNSYAGITEIKSYPRINTGPEYIAQKREANRTTGLWNGPADDAKIFTSDELAAISSGTWTDFRDLLFDRGVTQSHQVGIAASGQNTRAYLSLGTYNETGILEMDELQRYTVRLNLDHSLSDQFKVGTNSQVTYYDRDYRRDPTNLANKIAPLTAAYDENGDLILFPNSGKDISPLADVQPNAFTDNELQTYVVPSVFAEWQPLGGLTLRSNLGASLTGTRRGAYASPNTIDRSGAASQATYRAYNSQDFSWENILTYRADVGDHSLTLTGVTSYLSDRSDFSDLVGRNQLLPSQLFYALQNATEGVGIQSGYTESKLFSYAGRVNYDWQDRYLLTLTGRFDGSSRLSQGNQWAFFPSVALAWRVSDEPFMADQGLFSDLKLRVSYGVSGNDAVAPYSTQANLINVPYSFGDRQAPGFAFGSRVSNPDLKWELSANANLGLDFALWDNRVSGSVDVYQTSTRDLLLERFLPLTSGVSEVVQNIGRTRNRGFELALTTQNLETENLNWQSNLTFFTNQERIVDLVNGTNDIANGWFIGYPAQVFYDYEKVGIWQMDQAAEAAKFGQQPGEIRVKDQNGDGKITADDDRVILGTPRPKWSAGLTNNLTYRNFDFAATVFARIGQMMNYGWYDLYKPDGVENGSAVDYWTPENPTNAFPRPNARFSKGNYLYYSSLRYADGSFVKLGDATIGYTLPESVAERLRMGRARVYLTGKNLATWAEVDNYDPERGGSLTQPMTRVFVAGVDVGF